MSVRIHTEWQLQRLTYRDVVVMRMRTDALKDAHISFEKNSENGSQSESPQLIAYHEKEEFEWREVFRGMFSPT